MRRGQAPMPPRRIVAELGGSLKENQQPDSVSQTPAAPRQAPPAAGCAAGGKAVSVRRRPACLVAMVRWFGHTRVRTAHHYHTGWYFGVRGASCASHFKAPPNFQAALQRTAYTERRLPHHLASRCAVRTLRIVETKRFSGCYPATAASACRVRTAHRLPLWPVFWCAMRTLYAASVKLRRKKLSGCPVAA